MAWTVRLDKRAAKQVRAMDRVVQQRILKFLNQRLLEGGDPRLHGKAMQGQDDEVWIYRVGDYRLLCELKDDEWLVLVIEAGHRREIYERFSA